MWVGLSCVSSSPCSALSVNQRRKLSSSALRGARAPWRDTNRPAREAPRDPAGTRPRSSSPRIDRTAPSRPRPPRTRGRAPGDVGGTWANRQGYGTGPRPGSRRSRAPGVGDRSAPPGTRCCRRRRSLPAVSGPKRPDGAGPKTAMSSTTESRIIFAPAAAPETHQELGALDLDVRSGRESNGDRDRRRLAGTAPRRVHSPSRLARKRPRPTGREPRPHPRRSSRRSRNDACTRSRSSEGGSSKPR